MPIEDSVGEMAKLVDEGKIRFVGLSECTVEQLERAQRVHPITSVQSELSLWTCDPLAEVLPFCREHQIGFLPFSPPGRGFLTGDIERSTSFSKDDFRSVLPRFRTEALSTTIALTAEDLAELDALPTPVGSRY